MSQPQAQDQPPAPPLSAPSTPLLHRRWKGRWKGRWTMGVATLHLIVGVLLTYPFLVKMVQNGWLSTANDPKNVTEALVIWFFVFTPPLFVAGLLIDGMEKTQQPIPRLVPIIFLLMLVFMLSAQPISGGWLLFPPMLTLLFANPIKAP